MMKEYHYCKRCQSETVHKYLKTKDKTKRDNATMQITGINYVLIGNVHNDQRELLIEELEKITEIKKNS